MTARRETGYRPGLRSVTSTGGAARICQVLRLAQVLGSRLRDSAGFTPDFPWGQIRGFSCVVNIPRVAPDVNAKRPGRQSEAKKLRFHDVPLRPLDWWSWVFGSGHFAREGVYMAWSWQYLTAEGVVVAELPDTSMATEFPSQSDAETWIGEVWQTLLDAGIEQVLLLEEDRIVYGPMGLRPE